MRLIELMTIAGARIVKLDETKGTLKDGADADVTVIDPKMKWTIDAEQFASKSRNCPFHGWEVTGRAVATVVGGAVKWRLTPVVWPCRAGRFRQRRFS
jgi:dihydroorotase